MTTLRITDEQFEHWRTHGYVVVEKFFTADEVAEAQAALHEHYYPTWQEFSEGSQRCGDLSKGGSVLFPHASEVVNHYTLHPALIDIAEVWLRTSDIRLTDSTCIAKYATAWDHEQQLHCDYANNTIVYPTDDPAFGLMPVLIYWTDVTVDLSPTYVVPRTKTEQDLPWPAFADPDSRPDLYANQVPVVAPAGSVIFYTMHTWHRGSALHASEGYRLSQHPVFRNADAPWTQRNGWASQGHTPELRTAIVGATPRQRALLDFPPPGSPYWNPETLAGVARRYPEIDLDPYRP